MTEPDRQNKRARRWRPRPESWWWLSAVVVVPVVVLTGLTALVLILATRPTHAGDQIELVKTALSVGAGTGGVVALVLAGRRQWHAEEAQRDTREDAAARRVTELYAKAADQLASDKAPIRMAGLYAFERLAQDNPRQRESIVNVLCAYLRMPYTPPTAIPPSTARVDVRRGRRRTALGTTASSGTYHVRTTASAHRAEQEDRRQEREVRLAAQRILATHLQPPGPVHTVDTFWPDITLDLTGATLIDFTLQNCRLTTGHFNRARFDGVAGFNKAQFDNIAEFSGAQFGGGARFSGAQFGGDARFNKAQFDNIAEFSGAQFGGDARFNEAQFGGGARFNGAQFASVAGFNGAQFASDAGFGRARFAGVAGFNEAQFAGVAGFNEAQFAGVAWFGGARFAGVAWFNEARFADDAEFGGAQFDDFARFGGARFADAVNFSEVRFVDVAGFSCALPIGSVAWKQTEPCWVRLDAPDTATLSRRWPSGWHVLPTTERPPDVNVGEWGRLVEQSQA